MQTLNCLHLENEEQDLRTFGYFLKLAWERLKTNVEFRLTQVTNAEAALEILQSRGSEYHLLVADILLPDAHNPEGLHVVSVARDLPGLAILVLSSGDATISKRVTQLGVKFVSKLVIRRDDEQLRELGAAMLEVLRSRNFDPYAGSDAVLRYGGAGTVDELPLSAVVERIGVDVIRSVVRQLLDRSCTEINLTYVHAGLSGAAVLRADCAMDRPGQARQRRPILLKLSRDRGLLHTEYARRQEAVTFPTGLFIPFLDHEPVEAGGWYAIGVDFHPYARTFSDWLLQGRREDEIDSALSSLFLEGGLSEVYTETVEDGSLRPNVALWNVLVLPRRAHIYLALQQLSELASRHDGGSRFDPEIIIRFLDSKRFGNVDEERVPYGTICCRGHGDLHARNILVEQRRTSHLIDPAAISHMHWALDAARLIVDLLVTTHAAGLESYEWDLLSEWVSICSAMMEGRDPPTPRSEVDGAIQYAVRWVTQNMPEIYRAAWSAERIWEFRLAMAIEYLRASGRAQELPPPKRVLALHAACDALRSSAAAFNSR